MTKPSTRARKRAQPLDQELILRCAMRLADESGLDAVSMRTVATELGVEAMSLYKHVASKDAMLSGIVDLVIAEIDVPAGDSDWKAAMRRRAVSAHEVLRRHPWAAALIESHASTGPIRLRYADSILGVLRSAGFSVRQSYEAFLTLDSFIYGFTLQEVSWPYEPHELAEAVRQVGPHIPASEYPHVNEVMTFTVKRRAAAAARGKAYEEEFDFGLELILDGLSRTLEKRGRSA